MRNVVQFAAELFEEQEVLLALHQSGLIDLHGERTVIGRPDSVGRVLHESAEDALHGPKVHCA
jgi:hypothetical protein